MTHHMEQLLMGLWDEVCVAGIACWWAQLAEHSWQLVMQVSFQPLQALSKGRAVSVGAALLSLTHQNLNEHHA